MYIVLYVLQHAGTEYDKSVALSCSISAKILSNVHHSDTYSAKRSLSCYLEVKGGESFTSDKYFDDCTKPRPNANLSVLIHIAMATQNAAYVISV